MATVAYEMWVSRIRETGAIHVPLEELPVSLAEFRLELRRAAKRAGMTVRSSAQNDAFLAWNLDHVVTEEQLRAAFEAGNRCTECGDFLHQRGRAYECPTGTPARHEARAGCRPSSDPIPRTRTWPEQWSESASRPHQERYTHT